jgi:hypothetical protein
VFRGNKFTPVQIIKFAKIFAILPELRLWGKEKTWPETPFFHPLVEVTFGSFWGQLNIVYLSLIRPYSVTPCTLFRTMIAVH